MYVFDTSHIFDIPFFRGLAAAMVVSAAFLLLLKYLASVLVLTVILGVLGVGAYGMVTAAYRILKDRLD